MAYTPIDTELYDGNEFNGMPLSSAVMRALAENADYSAQNRLKRHTINYNELGEIGTDIKTKLPTVTTNLTGSSMVYGFTEQVDPNTIGLQFSTPAQDILTLPPILWPLSAQCNQIKVLLNMACFNGDMDVYVFGRLDGDYVGVPVTQAVYPDSDGVLQFNAEAQASDSYVQVGTSTTVYSSGTPVVLTLDLTEGEHDYSFHVEGVDSSRMLELFICFHSRLGSLDYTGKIGDGGNQAGGLMIEEGTFTYDSIAISGGSHNPATFHRWLKFTQYIGGIGEVGQNQPYRHVVQLRPGDLSDPESADKAKYVIWPRLQALPVIADDVAIQVYQIGYASLMSITIQEMYDAS